MPSIKYAEVCYTYRLIDILLLKTPALRYFLSGCRVSSRMFWFFASAYVLSMFSFSRFSYDTRTIDGAPEKSICILHHASPSLALATSILYLLFLKLTLKGTPFPVIIKYVVLSSFYLYSKLLLDLCGCDGLQYILISEVLSVVGNIAALHTSDLNMHRVTSSVLVSKLLSIIVGIVIHDRSRHLFGIGA